MKAIAPRVLLAAFDPPPELLALSRADASFAIDQLAPDIARAELEGAPARWQAALFWDYPGGRKRQSPLALLNELRGIPAAPPCLVRVASPRREGLAVLQAGAAAYVHRDMPTEEVLLLIKRTLLASTATVGMAELRLRRIERLTEAVSRIMGDLDRQSLDERLHLIAQESGAILDAESSGVLLVARPGVLRLVASYGHRPDIVDLGREFEIKDAPGSGLTGAIAAQGRPFRQHGSALRNHPAVRGLPTRAIADLCYSLLAIPLIAQKDERQELVGMIRVDNKKDATGQPHAEIGFSDEDEYLLSLFGNAVIIAVENATLALGLKQLINNSPTSVIVNEVSGLITTFSVGAEKLLGYRADEVQQKLRVDQLYEDAADAREVGRLLRERNGQAIDYRSQLRTRDGNPIPIRLSATWFYDVQNQRSGTIGYFEDLRPLVRNEQRLEHLLKLSTVLHQVGDYMQQARDATHILRVFLNGVTANYGLRLNRAALLLCEETAPSVLAAAQAVGHLDVTAARADWEQCPDDDPNAFSRFIERLEGGGIESGPLEWRIRNLRFSLDHPEMGILRQVLESGHWQHIQGAALDTLPAELRAAFAPHKRLLVVPLVAASHRVGLLLADNFVSEVDLPLEECNLLMALASTTALAVANTRLLQETLGANEQLRQLFVASTIATSAQQPEAVLHEIVNCIRDSVNALWVSLFLINAGVLRDRISTREEEYFHPEKAFRPDGISQQVMDRREARFFDDTQQYRDQLNPIIFREQVGSAACIPFVVRGTAHGVVWIHGAQPRSYSESQRQALHLFVNQAAAVYESASRIKELDDLRHASEALTRAEGWEDVLRLIAEHGARVLKAQKTIVWFYDQVGERFVAEKATEYGVGATLMSELRMLSPRRHGASHRVLTSGRMLIEDTRAPGQRDQINEFLYRLLDRCAARSCQIVSLSLGKEHFGVLYALYDEPRSFSDVDIEQSTVFTETAASALKQAVLMEQISATNSTALNVTRAAVQDKLEDTLLALAAGLQRLTSCDIVAVYVYDEKRDRIDPKPIRLGVRRPRLMSRPLGRAENPVLSMALSLNQPRYVVNVLGEPVFQRSAFVREEGIHSCTIVPLRVGTAVVGALLLSYRTLHRRSDHDDRNIPYFADLAALTIQMNLLSHERNEQLRALKALHHAAFAISQCNRLDTLFTTLVEQAVEFISERSHTNCFAHYAQREGNYLRFAAAYPPSHLQGLRKHIGDIDLTSERLGITGQVALSGKLWNIANVQKVTGYLPYVMLPGIKSELAVPVIVRGVTVGVINVESTDIAAFTPHDEYAIDALAQYVAVAIEALALYDDKELVAQQMEAATRRWHLYEQINRATRLQDLNTLLSSTCQYIERDTANIASIRLYEGAQVPDGALALQAKMLVFDPASSFTYRLLMEKEYGGGRLRQAFGQGICGWVAQQQIPFRHGDVQSLRGDPQYIELVPKGITINSEVCVPIVHHNGGEAQLVGVLDVESPHYNAFSAEDEQFYGAVAEALAAAIHREQTKRRLAAVEGLALTGLVGSLYWHNMTGLINKINKYVTISRRELLSADALSTNIDELLSWIAERTDVTLYERMPPPLDPSEVQLIAVHQLLRELPLQLSQHEMYQDITCVLELDRAYDDVWVRANKEWLRHALRLLTNNAAQAMIDQATRCMTLKTTCLPNESYIATSVDR